MESGSKVSYIPETLDYLVKQSQETQNMNEINYLDSIQHGKISALNRENMINWIIETCCAQKITKRAEQLSIYYFDTFLSQKSVTQISILELIGYICISLALKYEEGREIPPKEINAFCENRYSIEIIITTEYYLLSLLNWELERPTPSEILNYLFAYTCEEFESSNICKCAEKFITVALCDYEISRNSPLNIAVASTLCVLENQIFQDFGRKWVRILDQNLKIHSEKIGIIAEKIKKKVQMLMSVGE